MQPWSRFISYKSAMESYGEAAMSHDIAPFPYVCPRGCLAPTTSEAQQRRVIAPLLFAFQIQTSR